MPSCMFDEFSKELRDVYPTLAGEEFLSALELLKVLHGHYIHLAIDCLYVDVLVVIRREDLNLFGDLR